MSPSTSSKDEGVRQVSFSWLRFSDLPLVQNMVKYEKKSGNKQTDREAILSEPSVVVWSQLLEMKAALRLV